MRLFPIKIDHEQPQFQIETVKNNITRRILLSKTESILLIVSTCLFGISVIIGFIYLYYTKYFKKEVEARNQMEEELDELYEDIRFRAENEKEWERERFSKMRHTGNSEFYSWMLIKKV